MLLLSAPGILDKYPHMLMVLGLMEPRKAYEHHPPSMLGRNTISNETICKRAIVYDAWVTKLLTFMLGRNTDDSAARTPPIKIYLPFKAGPSPLPSHGQ